MNISFPQYAQACSPGMSISFHQYMQACSPGMNISFPRPSRKHRVLDPHSQWLFLSQPGLLLVLQHPDPCQRPTSRKERPRVAATYKRAAIYVYSGVAGFWASWGGRGGLPHGLYTLHTLHKWVRRGVMLVPTSGQGRTRLWTARFDLPEGS